MNSETPIRTNTKTIYEVIIHIRGGGCWTEESTDWEALKESAIREVGRLQEDRRIADICRFDSILINQYDFDVGCARCIGVINLGFFEDEYWTHLSYFSSVVHP